MNILNKLWALIVYCLKSIKHGVLTLFLTIKLDIEQVFVHLFNGGRALKGSQAFDKQAALNQLSSVFCKVKPSYWFPRLNSRVLARFASISTEWNQFKTEIETLRLRIHQIRNQTEIGRASCRERV